ncbi:MAG: PepSY-like domain-containing protein [Muribaculaceae bacterium]|nr:PepSY-like domain-containing protein [Muribaculaceae bacterium]
MKRLLTFLSLFIVIATMAMADEFYTTTDKLPNTAKELLKTYFPKEKVALVEVEHNLFKKSEYDVKLISGTSIEFNHEGEWTDIDCKAGAVPAALVPSAIKTYVDKNFSGVKIKEIKRKHKGYEVDLADGIELEFDTAFRLKKIDMD